MRISRLKVKNFRSIEEIDVALPQVCALVGPNNAGKSNVLEAIRRVMAGSWLSVNSFDEHDIYRRESDRDIEIWCTIEPAIGHHEFAAAPAVDVSCLHFQYTKYKTGAKKGAPRLEQRCYGADGGTINVLAKAPKRGQQHEYKPLIGIPSEVKDAVPVIYIGTNRSLAEQLPSGRYSLLRQMFQDIDKDLHAGEHTMTITGADGQAQEVSRTARFRRLIDAAMKTLRSDEFVRVETAIKRNVLRQLGFDPEADTNKLELSFAPFATFDFYKSLDLLVSDGDFSVSATEMGEGMQNAIVLAILQAFEETRKKGAVLLIEEPEMFLHPQMQRALYKTLREIGKSNQVIYTTHSSHFVAVPEYHEVMLVRKGAQGTKASFSSLPTDQRRREKLIKELDPERSELFFSRRLLIVEGDTEKLALPVYAEKRGINVDLAGATIIEVGGKRNLGDFAEIAISFGIPTGIVYDRDSSDFNDKTDEAQHNAKLDALATTDGSVKVWMLAKDYEDHLRRAVGDAQYGALCQKFPRTGKPTRARLIALEEGLPTPAPIDEIIDWLAGGPAGGTEL